MGSRSAADIGIASPPAGNGLIGLAFEDSDDVIRSAIDEASVPALLMSMIHMTGDLKSRSKNYRIPSC